MAGVLLSLTAVEIFLRLAVEPVPLTESRFLAAQGEGPETPGPEAAAKAMVHPFLGWSGRPSRPWKRPPNRIRRNVFGLASSTWDYRQLEERDYVVGIFGGSVALGLAMDGERALTERLEELRPSLAGRVKVITCAEGGYKQPQQLMLLAELQLLGVPLDAIVNLDGFNEMALGMDNATAGRHPLFPSQSHLRRLLSLGVSAPSEEDLLVAARLVTSRRKAESRRQWVETSSLARLRLVRDWAARSIRRAERAASEAELELGAQDAGRPIAASLPDPCLKKPKSCQRLMIDAWDRASRSMHELSRISGSSYLHFLQPNQNLEGTKPLSAEETERFSSPNGRWSQAYRRAYPELQRRGERLGRDGVDFVDLTRLFEAHTETLYRDRCCHLNQRGTDLLARAIAFHIAERVSPSIR